MGAAAPFDRWCRSSLLVRRSLTARDETRRDQRQHSRHGSRILLPPPKTRRCTRRSKAAIAPQEQDFAASADNTNTERVWKEIIRMFF